MCKNVSSKRLDLEFVHIADASPLPVTLTDGSLNIHFVPVSTCSVIVEFCYGYEFGERVTFTSACERMSKCAALSFFDQLVSDGFK